MEFGTERINFNGSNRPELFPQPPDNCNPIINDIRETLMKDKRFEDFRLYHLNSSFGHNTYPEDSIKNADYIGGSNKTKPKIILCKYDFN